MKRKSKKEKSRRRKISLGLKRYWKSVQKIKHLEKIPYRDAKQKASIQLKEIKKTIKELKSKKKKDLTAREKFLKIAKEKQKKGLLTQKQVDAQSDLVDMFVRDMPSPEDFESDKELYPEFIEWLQDHRILV